MANGKGSKAASKADVETVRTELSATIDSVRTELSATIDSVRTELSATIDSVRTELSAKIDSTRNELNSRIDATKNELNAKIDKVSVGVVKTQAELRDLRRTMATKDDVGRILAAIDSFAGKAKAYDQKALSHGAILTDHEDKLRAHGRRLTSLESKP